MQETFQTNVYEAQTTPEHLITCVIQSIWSFPFGLESNFIYEWIYEKNLWKTSFFLFWR